MVYYHHVLHCAVTTLISLWTDCYYAFINPDALWDVSQFCTQHHNDSERDKSVNPKGWGKAKMMVSMHFLTYHGPNT